MSSKMIYPSAHINLSLIIPVYNEESNLNVLFERLKTTIEPLNIGYEFIFVDDGSRDSSLKILQELANNHAVVRYISFSRNFGHQIAVSAGLDNARGQAVVIIDADLQDPPELIVSLYQKLHQGYEVVYAKRRRRQGESLLKRFTAKVFYRVLKNITSINIPVDTGDFRIISHKIVSILRQMPEQHKFLRGQIAWAGFRQTYIEYDRDERHGGKTGYTYSKMFRFALDGITSFSDAPLKLATFLGFFVAFVAVLGIIVALYARFVTKDYVPGWASLLLSILFLGSIQLLSLGVIGEYISRISGNIRQRPIYIVDKSNVEKEGEGVEE